MVGEKAEWTDNVYSEINNRYRDWIAFLIGTKHSSRKLNCSQLLVQTIVLNWS